MISKNVTFATYEIQKHNPIEKYKGKKIVALADAEGNYTLYVHLDNGLGLSTTEKLSLHEVAYLAYGYADELEFMNNMVYIDLPHHVLNQPSIFSRKLKKDLKKRGLYWSTRNGGG